MEFQSANELQIFRSIRNVMSPNVFTQLRDSLMNEPSQQISFGVALMILILMGFCCRTRIQMVTQQNG